MTDRAALKSVVHVVEDEESVRDALVWLFKSRDILSIPYESGEHFLRSLNDHTQPIGCVVLDVRMNGMSGLEVFDHLRAIEMLATLPTIFLTGHGDVQMAVEAVKKGAFDFFEKPFNNNRLVDRVIEAMEASCQNAEQHARGVSKRLKLATLSPREHEVMEKILIGKLNKIIADELGISMRTVEVHRSNIFTKLGVKSAVELAQWLKD